MSQQENTTGWIETPLSEFGHKCIMNKHDICTDLSCGCLCHQATFDLSLEKQKSPLSVTKHVTWLSQ